MHDFEPVEPGVDQCDRCGLPNGHRNHTATTTVESPDFSTRRRTVLAHNEAAAVEAAFRALCDDDTTPKALVFGVIALAGRAGATDDELYASPELAGLGQNTIRPRRIDLENEGLVEKAKDGANVLVKRATRTGGVAQVWVLTDKARQLMAVHARLARTA